MRHIYPLVLVLLAGAVFASPDFRTVQNVAGIRMVRDTRNNLIRYYFPGELRLAASPEGEPDVRVLDTRYRGTALHGDAGTERFSCLLRLTLQIPAPSPEALSEARKSLGPRVELRPLPLEKITVAVIHLPLNEQGSVSGSRTLPPGVVETGNTNSDESVVWTEHHETLRLDPDSAQLMADSWRKGRLLLSIGYTIHSDGIAPDAPLARLEGTPELVTELNRVIGTNSESAHAASTNETRILTSAGAIGVSIDSARWPNTWKRLDLNESAPPGYPLLEARCYDFSEGTSPLYEKHLQIEAESLAGKKVQILVRFQRANRAGAVQLAPFRVAVRIDRPYRYRVESILEDGSTAISRWMTNQSWTQLIDISEQAMASKFSPAKQP